MERPILQIYAYLVCFVTISCGAIFAGIAAYDVVEIAAPTFTVSNEVIIRHSNNEVFADRTFKSEDARDYSDEQITKLRNESFESQLAMERRTAIQSLVRSLIILLLDGMIFAFHWRIGRRVTQ